MRSESRRLVCAPALTLLVAITIVAAPHRSLAAQPASALPPMLRLPQTGEDPALIDFAKLSTLEGSHSIVTAGEKPWMCAAACRRSWWISRLEARGEARNVVLARGATRKDRSRGDCLKAAPPGRQRSPQRHTDTAPAITSRVGAPSAARTLRDQSRVAREGGRRMGARRDVTGIPVSVLPPGVEV